ncbi:LysR family transcriptional regulator [Sinorhizobium mexicanum]|uniref:LysR family transcriptional regulator n=1 Tax=Sinorhizobium mexicanum TaxID=375549 RepID=A0A859R276_9HYPH|nr:LysR family transcriptional regulator [Sinorhizobium mexicanum]
MDRLKTMEVFVRVVEAGSLSKAAATLSAPRSSVTMAMNRLEKHLGVRLLQRTTRNLSLTADGEAYYAECRRILHDIDAVEASLRRDLKSLEGRLRVDMPVSIATSVVIPKLDLFRSRHPGIRIAIGANDRRLDLVQEGIDCVIRTGELADSALVGKRIGRFNWITCATPEYLSANAAPKTPADLEAHKLIGYFHGNGTAEKWTYMNRGKPETIQVDSEVSVNETSAYLSLGLGHHGIVRLADYIVQPFLDKGQLVELLAEYRPVSTPVSILYPTSRHLSPLVRAFVDWAATLFEPAVPGLVEKFDGQQE